MHLTMSFDQPVVEGESFTVGDCIADNAKSPAQHIVAGEANVIIQDCVAALTRQQRELLKLLLDKGLSYEQLAGALCIEVGTVKSRVSRTRDALRRAIAATSPDLAQDDDVKAMFATGAEHGTERVRTVA